MPRLGSKKSRTGCRQCKARHVKCDESRPCKNCLRHKVDCSLIQTQRAPKILAPVRIAPANQVMLPATRNRILQPNIPKPHRNLTENHLPLENRPHPRLGVVTVDDSAKKSIQDVQLMHHYSTCAYRTIPGDSEAQKTWLNDVPREGFKHGFLLHSVLAFSAYHLAFLNPLCPNQYSFTASDHQIAAINGLRAVLSEIDQENCHAVFATASLLALNAFTQSQANDSIGARGMLQSDSSYMDDLIELSSLLRGLNAVLETTEPMLTVGPFGPIFQNAYRQLKSAPILDVVLAEVNSDKLWSSTSASPLTISSLIHLRNTINFCSGFSSHSTLRIVLLWLIRVEPQFFDVVKLGHDHGALSVFKHYRKILESAARDWWFLEKWAKPNTSSVT